MKKFPSKKHNHKISIISKKYQKVQLYNGYRSAINIAKIQNMSKIEILTYTLDKYNLQTRIISFPDHEKLLKEIDIG